LLRKVIICIRKAGKRDKRKEEFTKCFVTDYYNDYYNACAVTSNRPPTFAKESPEAYPYLGDPH
jgi:hypothetical protein